MLLIRRYQWPLTLAVLTLLPQTVFAQFGGAAVTGILNDVVTAVFPIVMTVSILTAIIIGLTLVSTSDESHLQKAKGAMIALIAGAFLVKLTPTIVSVLFTQQAFMNGGVTIINNIVNFNLEIIGIAQWFEMLAVTVAVFMIILAGFRAVVSFGNEAAITAVRQSVLQGIGGILLLVFVEIIRAVLFDVREPNPLIQAIFVRVNIFLGLVAIIMIAVIIYAGFLMVVSVASESNNERAKGIIFRAIIGLIVVLLSVVLVQIVIGLFS